ncbi:MAG: peptidoglycan-binding domain-containing protein [Cyanobacteriota bacterium]|nr:peptidoglycan-binding domain-containing protein [Cyanobacteriota bacterium]
MPKYFLTIKEGSTGDTVVSIQEMLKQLGFYFGSINGTFDDKTKAAVIKFQENNAIRADGVVGIATKAALVRFFWN